MDAILARHWMSHDQKKYAGLEFVEDGPVEAVLHDFGFAPVEFSLGAPKDLVASKAPGKLSYESVVHLFSSPDLAEGMLTATLHGYLTR